MSYFIYNTGEDYSKQIIGEWNGVQYVQNKQLYPCDDETSIDLVFTEDTISISGTLLESGDYSYKWNTGSIAKVDYRNEENCIFVVSINSINQLKVTINSMDYIITFNRNDK